MNEINHNFIQNLIGGEGEAGEPGQTPSKSPRKKLQQSSSEKRLAVQEQLVPKPFSKILKIQQVLNQDKLKLTLASFGKVLFCESHYLNKE